jgi:hypothetical protein
MYVGVDVGGTNTRIAVSSGQKGEVIRVCKFRAGTVAQVEKGLARTAALLSPLLDGKTACGCALGVAGRVFADRRGAEITNFGVKETITTTGADTTESVESTAAATIGQEIYARDLPAVLCPPQRTIFLNDLQCACYGMRALDAADQLADLFSPLWPSDAPPASLQPHHRRSPLLRGEVFAESAVLFLFLFFSFFVRSVLFSSRWFLWHCRTCKRRRGHHFLGTLDIFALLHSL